MSQRGFTRRTGTLVVVAIAAFATVGGIAAGTIYALVSSGKIDNPLATSMTISGTVTLGDGDFINTGSSCFGEGGYGDMHKGTQVVITDASQKTVAVGAIDSAAEVGGECRLSFRITDVPKGSDFYGVTIARRGTLQYGADDLVKPLELTLG